MIALVPGHNRLRRGAVSTDGTSENPWAIEVCVVARDILAGLHIPCVVVERTPGEGEYRRLAQAVLAAGADAVVEVHFDVAAGPARGALGLHWPGATKAARLAELLAAKVSHRLGIPNRGTRGQAQSWAGSDLSYRYTGCPHAILEACDGTDPADWSAASDPAEVGQAIAEAVEIYVEENP